MTRQEPETIAINAIENLVDILCDILIFPCKEIKRYKPFAQCIKELRLNRKMTAYDLAGKIGKTPGYISHIEARGAIPSPKLTISMAKILGEKPEKLLEIAKTEKTKKAIEVIQTKYNKYIRKELK